MSVAVKPSTPYREDREPCRECARREAEDANRPWSKTQKCIAFASAVMVFVSALCALHGAVFLDASVLKGAILGFEVSIALLVFFAPAWVELIS